MMVGIIIVMVLFFSFAGFSRDSSDRKTKQVLYDPIKNYELTKSEYDQLNRDKLVVCERLCYFSYAEAYYDIYRRDLPVYVSADSLFHAVHRSFDTVLNYIEDNVIKPRLINTLKLLSRTLAKHKGDPASRPLMLRACVALKLLGIDLDVLIDQELEDEIKRMASAVVEGKSLPDRNRNFNICLPRGRYFQKPAYFRAIMYLSHDPLVIWFDTNDALNNTSDVEANYEALQFLRKLISQDSKLRNAFVELEEGMAALLGQPTDLGPCDLNKRADGLKRIEFRDHVYNVDSMNLRFRTPPVQTAAARFDVKIEPPLCFSLLPKRQSMDSTILRQVINTRVKDRYQASPRDVSAALGCKLSQKQMITANASFSDYKSNLDQAIIFADNASKLPASQRGAAGEWMLAMRALFKQRNYAKSGLGVFASNAYQQKRQHTFMGTFAEYRHDLLAYAAIPFPDGSLCEYTAAFVDPFPECYAHISSLYGRLAGILAKQNAYDEMYVLLKKSSLIFSNLELIARKELDGKTLTHSEEVFLKNLIDIRWPYGSGTITYSGWYNTLLGGKCATDVDITVGEIMRFGKSGIPAPLKDKTMLLGVGPINLCFYRIPFKGKEMVFVGPSYSVYQTLIPSKEPYDSIAWRGRIGMKDYARLDDILKEKIKIDERLQSTADYFGRSPNMSMLSMRGFLGEILLDGQSVFERSISQPECFSIINRIKKTTFQKLGSRLKNFSTFPLRYKLSDGASITKQITEMSRLKCVTYEKPSHTIYVTPSALLDEQKLSAYILKLEQDQFEALAKADIENLRTKISELTMDEQMFYYQQNAKLFMPELRLILKNGPHCFRRHSLEALSDLKSITLTEAELAIARKVFKNEDLVQELQEDESEQVRLKTREEAIRKLMKGNETILRIRVLKPGVTSRHVLDYLKKRSGFNGWNIINDSTYKLPKTPFIHRDKPNGWHRWIHNFIDEIEKEFCEN